MQAGFAQCERLQAIPYALRVAATLPVRNAILDGEIICMDRDGVSRFNELMFRRGVPYLYAFDLMWLNDHDPRTLRLIDRKECLNSCRPRICVYVGFLTSEWTS